MKRKDFGNTLLFVVLAILGVIFGCVKLMDVSQAIIHSERVTIVLGILIGLGIGGGLTSIINNIRNNKLDKKLWDDMKLTDKIEVTKIEDTNN